MEAYSPSACSVRGGEELVLTGSNFLPDSKVVFIERGPGEYPFWEEELGTGRVNSLCTSKWSLNFLTCKMERKDALPLALLPLHLTAI